MSVNQLQLIENNRVVSMHYTLTDDEGHVIDSSEGQDPLTYLHGAANIIPGLESALTGKSIGDKLEVRVEAKDAYGEPQVELLQKVDRQVFEGVEDLEPGMIFKVQGPDQQTPHQMMIRSIDGDEVVVDGNHPLAGVALNFAVEIIAIREASETEIEHGHAHATSECDLDVDSEQ